MSTIDPYRGPEPTEPDQELVDFVNEMRAKDPEFDRAAQEMDDAEKEG